MCIFLSLLGTGQNQEGPEISRVGPGSMQVRVGLVYASILFGIRNLKKAADRAKHDVSLENVRVNRLSAPSIVLRLKRPILPSLHNGPPLYLLETRNLHGKLREGGEEIACEAQLFQSCELHY